MPEFHALGATLTAISPQLPEHSAELVRKHGLRFPLLHDRDFEITRAYRLEHDLPDYLVKVYDEFGTDVAGTNGEERARLPLPARYIVDIDRIVRYARVHPDYTTRPEPSDTLAALRHLIQAG